MAILIGIACDLGGFAELPKSRPTGLVLLVLAFCAFSVMMRLYRRDDS